MYKILSRAANNRLKRIRDLFFSRAQKGFTGSCYIQEVLINALETISFCKYNGIEGVMVSIDQAKAFDSINHSFMNEVYKFFGIGPNFRNMMATFCVPGV
jgi:hypothetical protein